MFRFKSGVNADYDRQGYIHFTSRQYKRMSKEDQKKIIELCKDSGGEYCDALLEFVTTEISVTALTLKHYISKATLYRLVKKYYENFPDKF